MCLVPWAGLCCCTRLFPGGNCSAADSCLPLWFFPSFSERPGKVLLPEKSLTGTLASPPQRREAFLFAQFLKKRISLYADEIQKLIRVRKPLLSSFVRHRFSGYMPRTVPFYTHMHKKALPKECLKTWKCFYTWGGWKRVSYKAEFILRLSAHPSCRSE